MTPIILEHNFRTKTHDLVALFEGTTKMSAFMRKLEAQAELDVLRYDRDKYCGDGFELFVELFLKLHPTDNRVGVYNYEPVQENDNGVDGIGVNILKQPSVVQIKYRSNTQSVLTTNIDHIGNLIVDGMGKFNVVYDADPKVYRHFIFTTAEGLHYYTDNDVFKKKVKCIGYNDFRSMLDNNLVFWQSCVEIVKNCNLS
jgi:hypothetical protein